VKITCVVCGSEKETTRRTAKYCSRRCMGLGQKGHPKPHTKEHEDRRVSATRAANAKRVYLKTGPRPAGVIEKMHTGRTDWVKANPDRARALSVANLPKDVAMEKNPNWRGGRTKVAKDFYTRNSGKMVKWRKQVFKRDGHKCKDCGSPTRLECHHILPLVVSKAFAFHRANGVTLCRDCHKKTDSYATKGRDSSAFKHGRDPGSIHILFIPEAWHDYDTVGNWQIGTDGQSILILVTRMKNPIYQQAVALHELTEAMLCLAAGVTPKAVDDFDMGEGKDLDEPGFDPRAPYHRQHCWADVVERTFIAAAGLSWTAYDQSVGDHGCEC